MPPDLTIIRYRAFLVVGREERPQFPKGFVVEVGGEPEIGRAEIGGERFTLADDFRFVAAKAEKHIKRALARHEGHRPIGMKSAAEFHPPPGQKQPGV